MKNKILLFALMFCIAATLFVVSVAADDNIQQEVVIEFDDADWLDCGHNYTEYIIGDGHCVSIYKDGLPYCHALHYRCGVCNAGGYVVNNYNMSECDVCHESCEHYFRELVTTSTNDERRFVKELCVTCGTRTYVYEDGIVHNYNGDTCIDCDYICTHSKMVGADCYYCEYTCPHADHTATKKTTDAGVTTDYYCNDCKTTYNSVFKAHNYVGLSCLDCKYVCNHSSLTGADCDYCSFVCPHSYNEKFVCTVCGLRCDHKFSKVNKVTYVDDDYHYELYVCEFGCGYEKNTKVAHAYSSKCECSCGDIVHSGNYVESYENGNANEHFYVVRCKDCGDLIEETHVPHNDPNISFVYSYTFSTDLVHNAIKKCSDCGAVVSTTSSAHKYDSFGYCSICKAKCKHAGYSGGKCIGCGVLCVHNIVHSYKTIGGVRYDNFACTKCGEINKTMSNLSSNVPFFDRLTTVDLWNINSNGYAFDGKYLLQRFTIKNFDNNVHHSATVNIIGGTSYMQAVDKLPYCRYVVLRMRYKGVNTMEFDIMGAQTYNNEKISTLDMRVIGSIPIKNLPVDTWVNVVLDMNTLQGKNVDKYSIDTAFYNYLRVVSCFQYAQADGYVDIDYLALAQNKAQLDALLSYSYGEYDSSYYIYTGKFTKVDNTHSFNDDHKCTRCNWTCKHLKDDIVDYITPEYCGQQYICYYCSTKLGEPIYDRHIFENNSVVCVGCGTECYHDYKNGVCRVCKRTCTHGYANESIRCIYCGLYARDGGSGGADQDTLYNMFAAIYDTQTNTFFSMLNFTIFGVNIAALILGIISLGIALVIIKKVL